MSYRWGIPHLAYFKALASEPNEQTSSWRSTLAGLVAMRLVDAWAQGDPLPAAGIQALERAINMMDLDVPEAPSLRNIAAALRAERAGRQSGGDSSVLPLVREYAEILWQTAAWTLAADCCRTIIRHAKAESERALVPLVYDRLGHCLSARGRSDAAVDAFRTGRTLANERGDLAADLQLRVSEAHLESQRGLGTAAECMLDEVTVEATFAGLRRLGAQALHARGVIAYKRGDTARALELYLRALSEYGDDRRAERALADLALVWLDQGYHGVARGVFERLAQDSLEGSQRSVATMNLMHIAVLEGDEPRFDAYHRALARAVLAVRHQAHYYLIAAEGWLRFERPTLARRSLTRAANAIRRGGITDLMTRWSDCQRALAASARKREPKANAVELPRTAPVEFEPLAARTRAATLSWRGGRRSQVTELGAGSAGS